MATRHVMPLRNKNCNYKILGDQMAAPGVALVGKYLIDCK
jgi:hypothetical protein